MQGNQVQIHRKQQCVGLQARYLQLRGYSLHKDIWMLKSSVSSQWGDGPGLRKGYLVWIHTKVKKEPVKGQRRGISNEG